jgi:nucleotide-binding universal stress UspA family protein
MSYKTIGVHVDRSVHAPARIRVAASLALREQAHLIGIAFTGAAPLIVPAGGFDQGMPPMRISFEELRLEAERALDLFEEEAGALGVNLLERRLVEEEAGYGMSLQARYCDLVVLGQLSGSHMPPLLRTNFTEYVLLHCARPVLVVPADAPPPATLGQRILVAWNGSHSATRALSSALSLLERAEQVEVVVFNPEQGGDAHGEDPGADIGLYLARHRIAVQVSVAQAESETGSALMAYAERNNADLVVMGAYGHSRMREILLASVTGKALRTASLPLWMAH